MIALFSSLRIAELVLYAMVAMLSYWGWETGAVSVYAAVAFGVLGLGLVAFGVRLRAVMMHQNLINILYKQLDPVRFIVAYEPLLEKARRKPVLESTVRNYLSLGYLAGGDFKTAVRILEETPAVAGKESLRGQALQQCNLSNAYIHAGDANKSEEHLRRFEALVASDTEGTLSANMAANVTTLRNYIKVLRGWDPDEKFLTKMAYYTTTDFDQVVNRYFLAVCQQQAKKKAEAAANLRRVAKRAPKLYLGKEAVRRLEEMGESLEGPDTVPTQQSQVERIVERPFLNQKKKWGIF